VSKTQEESVDAVDEARLRDVAAKTPPQYVSLEGKALQSAILNSANFSIIATDTKGMIRLFNVGAERLLGYVASHVIGEMEPSGFHDAQEVIARAAKLSAEFANTVTPGFGALAYKASRGIEDKFELTIIRKDGSRFPG